MGAGHESLEARRPPKTATDRSFGYTVGGILLAIGCARFVLGSSSLPVTYAIAGAGAVLLAGALLRPAALAPLNRGWTRLGLLMGEIVNPIIMLAIFALIFVPVALAMRLFGRDALAMRRRRDAAPSYWIDRTPPGPAPAGMNNLW